jgi:hypothetical protein
MKVLEKPFLLLQVGRSVFHDSSKLMSHLDEWLRQSSIVVDPEAVGFNGQELAAVVREEVRKLSEPMNLLLVLDRVLTHAELGLPQEAGQDELMDLKHSIIRNIICNLYQDDRLVMTGTFTSEFLASVAAKLLFISDSLQGAGDVRCFNAVELYSMLGFLHKFLHGTPLQAAEPIQPSALDWQVLDKVLKK